MAQTIVSSGKIVRPKRPKNEVESVTSIFFSEISNYLPESFQQLIVLSQPESDPEEIESENGDERCDAENGKGNAYFIRSVL